MTWACVLVVVDTTMPSTPASSSTVATIRSAPPSLARARLASDRATTVTRHPSTWRSRKMFLPHRPQPTRPIEGATTWPQAALNGLDRHSETEGLEPLIVELGELAGARGDARATGCVNFPGMIVGAVKRHPGDRDAQGMDHV